MAFTRFENITVQNFGRVGIRATGNASNSDFMFMKDVQLRGNAIGFYENGTDTSASGFHNVNPYGNMMAGLIERSFLGNTWVNPFGEFNGEDPPLPGTANTTNLTRSGNVVTATLATALPSDSAGAPGVGNAIVIAGTTSAGTSFNGTFFIATISADRKTITWAQTGANESASGQGTARTGICSEAMAAAGWTPHGLSFVPAGAAVNTTVIGGYDEGAKTQFGPYAMVFGGNYGNVDWSDANVRPSVFITGGPNNGLSLPMRFRDVDLSGNAVRFFIKLGGECLNHTDNSLLCLVDTTQIANPNGYVSFKMKTIAGSISNWYGYQIGQSEFDYNDSFRIPNYNTLNPITGDSTNMGYQAGAWFPNGFYFGNTSIANRQGVSELGNSRITPTWSSSKGSLITSNLNIAAGGFGCWMNTGATSWYASCPLAKDSTGTQWQFPQLIIGTSQALTGTSGAGSTVIVNNADINASGQVTAGAITEAKQTLADNATWNASTSAHGYLKKLDNNATHYMDGTGNWSTPAGGTATSAIISHATLPTVNSDSIPAGTAGPAYFATSCVFTAAEGANVKAGSTLEIVFNGRITTTGTAQSAGFRVHLTDGTTTADWTSGTTGSASSQGNSVWILRVQGVFSGTAGAAGLQAQGTTFLQTQSQAGASNWFSTGTTGQAPVTTTFNMNNGLTITVAQLNTTAAGSTHYLDNLTCRIVP